MFLLVRIVTHVVVISVFDLEENSSIQILPEFGLSFITKTVSEQTLCFQGLYFIKCFNALSTTNEIPITFNTLTLH